MNTLSTFISNPKQRRQFLTIGSAALILLALLFERTSTLEPLRDAFMIAALPQSSAGNAFQATFAIGVLAAMIRPATPSGWRTTIAVLLGTALVVVWP